MTAEKKAPAERKNYSWTIATNVPRGEFRVGDWVFVDQDFTRAEKAALIQALPSNDKGEVIATTAEIVVAMLNMRLPSPQSQRVTQEWLDSVLGEADLTRVAEKLYVMAGIGSG